MEPALTYKDVCKYIASSNHKYENVKLIGILFVRPDANLAKKEFIPQFYFLNQGAGENIDFFCAGYTDGWTGMGRDQLDYVSTGIKANHNEWAFSHDSFNNFADEISRRSRWKYSGECDLILLNTFYNKKKRSVNLHDLAILQK